MIDGITSRPFSASTLPPMKVDPTSGVKEAIIDSSRKLYTRSRQEVEDEISKWSGMLQVGEGEAKYKADCSNCKKSTMVPFEPQEGRPVYCKECMFKIKSGELKPESGFVASRSSRQEEKVSTAPLAALGIEFQVVDTNFRVSKNKEQANPNPLTQKTNQYNNQNQNKNNFSNNNSHDLNKNSHVKVERKFSGPSPLLKGLLQKIGLDNNKDKVMPNNIEATEVKKEVPAPISLSSLKKEIPKDKKREYVAPVKEATEEKKASLKDLLAKTVNHNNHTENNIEVKKEIPKEEELPVLKEEVIVSNPKEEVATEKPIEIKKEENIPSGDSWQKRQTKKEVPEDVLRKVLE